MAGIWVKLSQLLLCKFRYWGFGFACFPHHGDGGLGFSCIALARAVDGAENENNAIRILGYFRADLGYFAEKSWFFCRPARSITTTAIPHRPFLNSRLPPCTTERHRV